MTPRRKILFVYNVSWFFLSHRLPVALKAQASGYEIHVAATPCGNDPAIISSYGFSYHPIKITRGGLNILLDFSALVQLYSLYKIVKPDLIEHATIKPVIYGGIAAYLAKGSKVVSWMTGLGYIFISDGWKSAIIRRFALAAYRFVMSSGASRVIFENPDDHQYFLLNRIVTENRARIIKGAGVDIDMFAPSLENPPPVVVTLAARMLWDKGVGEFVQAAKLLKESGVEARFVLVGDTDAGNPSSISHAKLKEWHDSGIIEWWGRQHNMSDVIARTHIVCLPSYREGLPKVLVEAAACGKPVVASDAPGCREIVRNDDNGILVPIRDHVYLAKALRKLIENRVLREQMGKRGRAIVLEEFTIDKVVQETLSLYDSLFA